MLKYSQLKIYLIGSVLSSIPLLFGGYLLFERVLCSIASGQIEERAGIIERSSEPISFWIPVLMYGVFGGLIVAFGLWGCWQTFKPKHSNDDQAPDG